MHTADKNDHIDDDILQSRADVLRAIGMTPAGEEQAQERSKPEDRGEDAARPADAGGGPTPAEPPESAEGRAAPAGAAADKSEIPRFDLSEDIMAEQRKITAVRRRGPGETKVPESSEAGVEGVSEAFGPVAPARPEEDESIADVVARDIERLLRGERADV